MRRHLFALGLAAALVYIVAAVLSVRAWNLPPRPLFDGLAPPPPYRWVDPPPEFEAGNQQPLGGEAVIGLGPEVGAMTVATEDGQALVSVPRRAFTPPPGGGNGGVRLTVTAVNPDLLGTAPGGLRFDGNAYHVTAQYTRSDAPVVLRQTLIVFLRYPVHADRLLRWSGTRWEALPSNAIRPSLQVWAETTEPGAFVAAAPAAAAPPSQAPHWAALGLLVAGAAGAATIAGLFARRRLARRRSSARKRRGRK